MKYDMPPEHSDYSSGSFFEGLANSIITRRDASASRSLDRREPSGTCGGDVTADCVLATG
jgi:hypothetical protein